MCGRLNVIEAPIVAFLAEFLGEVPFVESRGNVAPTEPVLALRAETSGYNAALMRWWLVPHWSTGPQHKFSMLWSPPSAAFWYHVNAASKSILRPKRPHS